MKNRPMGEANVVRYAFRPNVPLRNSEKYQGAKANGSIIISLCTDLGLMSASSAPMTPPVQFPTTVYSPLNWIDSTTISAIRSIFQTSGCFDVPNPGRSMASSVVDSGMCGINGENVA